MKASNTRPTSARWLLLAATVVTIAVGLASRRLPWAPTWIGDALWAAVVYFVISAAPPHAATWRQAAAALTFSYLVEAAQFYHWPWIDEIRATTLGHLALGSTFVWTDLFAYTAGIALGVALTSRWRPQPWDRNHRRC